MSTIAAVRESSQDAFSVLPSFRPAILFWQRTAEAAVRRGGRLGRSVSAREREIRERNGQPAHDRRHQSWLAQQGVRPGMKGLPHHQHEHTDDGE